MLNSNKSTNFNNKKTHFKIFFSIYYTIRYKYCILRLISTYHTSFQYITFYIQYSYSCTSFKNLYDNFQSGKARTIGWYFFFSKKKLTSLTGAPLSIALMDWTCYETNVCLLFLLLINSNMIILRNKLSHPVYHWNIKKHLDSIEVHRITLLWFGVKGLLLQVLSLLTLLRWKPKAPHFGFFIRFGSDGLCELFLF